MRGLDFCRADERGEIKLSLEQVFRALAVLGHERAIAVVEDVKLDKKSRWRAATEQRNASVLAHGVKPIGEAGYLGMIELLVEFFGYDLSRELNPIPALDRRWFE